MNRLQLPDFHAFLEEIGADRVTMWAEEGNRVFPSFNPMTGIVTPEGLSYFATALTAVNQQVTIAMLRDYHEWLLEKLEQVSLRLVRP